MKRLLTFDQLNELSNLSLVESYLNKIREEILKIDNSIPIHKLIYHYGTYSFLEFIYPIIFENKIEKILKKYTNKLEVIDIHISYNLTKTIELNMKRCTIYIKNKYSKRIKPNRYVYHCSPSENRESILKNGLIPKKHSESKDYKFQKEISYSPAIFATNSGIDGIWKSQRDVWKIDTKDLPNKWWYDLNFYSKYSRSRDEIMTYEPIPPEHLELVSKVSEKPSLTFAEINNL